MGNYPFGHQRNQKKANPSTNLADYKFTGKETDVESGLLYFEARYYLASIGSFTSADPLKSDNNQGIMIPQSWNIYRYTLNSPVILVDPSGMQEKNANENDYWGQHDSYQAEDNPYYEIDKNDDLADTGDSNFSDTNRGGKTYVGNSTGNYSDFSNPSAGNAIDDTMKQFNNDSRLTAIKILDRSGTAAKTTKKINKLAKPISIVGHAKDMGKASNKNKNGNFLVSYGKVIEKSSSYIPIPVFREMVSAYGKILQLAGKKLNKIEQMGEKINQSAERRRQIRRNVP